jgi:hypothetical protein
MFARTGQFVVAVALCLSIGGHWIGLQSIAWASMVANYSQQCSIAEALQRTFDGKHPCDLCKSITKSKEAEKKQDNERGVAKPDLICVKRQFAVLPPSAPYEYPALVRSSLRGFQQPPSPPPRLQFA